MNIRDKQRAKAKEAMPHVKSLVRRFGRRAVANCLNKLKEHDKSMAQLAAMKKQVADMERRL